MSDKENPAQVDRTKVAEAYLAYHQTADDGLAWAWDMVDADGFHDPETKWLQILEIVRQATTDDELGSVGSGPLENLLALHGPRLAERVEREARQDPAFRRALHHVWLTEPRGTPQLRAWLETLQDQMPDR